LFFFSSLRDVEKGTPLLLLMLSFMLKEYHETRGAQGNSQSIFRKIFAKDVDNARAVL